MVIIASREGKIGNRLWHASAFLANSKTHGYRVRHLYFGDLESNFSQSLAANSGSFPVRFGASKNRLVNSLIVYFVATLMKVCLKTGIRNLLFAEVIMHRGSSQGTEPFDLNNPAFVEKAKKKILFMYGWVFNDNKNIDKNSELIKAYWTPNENFMASINTIIADARKDADILVGVHIRRGDYSWYNKGDWYYSFETYAAKMKQFVLACKPGTKRVSFLICSDEETDLSPFAGLNVYAARRHYIEDMYGLARCDYIFGPPSTFSSWASFYGNVPLLMIRNGDQQVCLEDFKVIHR